MSETFPIRSTTERGMNIRESVRALWLFWCLRSYVRLVRSYLPRLYSLCVGHLVSHLPGPLCPGHGICCFFLYLCLIYRINMLSPVSLFMVHKISMHLLMPLCVVRKISILLFGSLYMVHRISMHLPASLRIVHRISMLLFVLLCMVLRISLLLPVLCPCRFRIWSWNHGGRRESTSQVDSLSSTCSLWPGATHPLPCTKQINIKKCFKTIFQRFQSRSCMACHFPLGILCIKTSNALAT